MKWNHSRKNWLPLHRAACSCFFHPLSTAMMWPSRVSTAAICQSKMFSPCLKALLLPQAGLGPQTAVSPTHTALPAKLVVWLPPNPQQQLLFSFSDNWSRQFTLIKHEKVSNSILFSYCDGLKRKDLTAWHTHSPSFCEWHEKPQELD